MVLAWQAVELVQGPSWCRGQNTGIVQVGSRGLVGADTCAVVAGGAAARILTDGAAEAARPVEARSTEEAEVRAEEDNSFWDRFSLRIRAMNVLDKLLRSLYESR